MRALTLYNDNVNVGISVIVESDTKIKWDRVEGDMEELVADLKTVPTIVSTLKTFKDRFKDVKFLSAKVYKGLRGRGTEEVMEDGTNPFQVSQRGYKVYNPETTVVDFA